VGALSGKNAKIKITAITPTSSTGEAFTKLSTGKYQITDITKRHWDRNTTGLPIVYVNTTARTAGEYTVDPVNGIIQFSPTSLTTGAVPVTADIHYRAASYLGQANRWTVEMETDVQDVTSFATSTGTKTWRDFQPNLTQGTVTIDRFWKSSSTGPEWYDRINLNSDLVVDLYAREYDHWRAYGWIETDTLETPIDDPVTDSVTIRLDGPLYYTTSS